MPRLHLSANTRATRVKLLETKIKNIQDKHDDIEDLPFDEQPFTETLKEAEIKKVSEKFNGKCNRNSNKELSYEDMLEEGYSDKSYTFVQDLEADGVNSVKAVACKNKTLLKSLPGIFRLSY